MSIYALCWRLLHLRTFVPGWGGGEDNIAASLFEIIGWADNWQMSLSDDKIQITFLILGRGALSGGGGAYLVDKQQELRHLEQRDLDRHKETCWHVHTKNKRQTYPKSSNKKIAHIFIQPVWESISRLSIVTGTQDVAALTRCKIELWKALFSDW